ncbi:MAG TPA: TMEM14 family protein [Isosphaeraceae bacterium]|jgi:uncharacterized membrane protein (UPF0136 family)|nr:TMEM14 family protein [Isosphaeraceae bacterium]
MTPTVGYVVLAIYAALLAAGGIMGYVKAASRPSLIAGVASAVLVAIGLALAASGIRGGFWLAGAVAIALTVLFGVRYGKSGKFMPSGMLGLVSVVVVALLAWLLLAPGS